MARLPLKPTALSIGCISKVIKCPKEGPVQQVPERLEITFFKFTRNGTRMEFEAKHRD